MCGRPSSWSGGERLDPLSRIAAKHATDKWGLHFYTPVYHRHFAHLRGRAIRLLEIGIGGYQNPRDGGHSLRMWKEYFPEATVVGLDIADKSGLAEDRIHIVQGSQTDFGCLAAVIERFGPFDIVIDDGSHRPPDVIATFDWMFPRLAADGVYAVEDTQTSYLPDWGGSADLAAPGTTLNHFKALADKVNHAEIALSCPDLEVDEFARTVTAVHFHHNLIFVDKGRNDEPSNLKLPPDDPHVARSLAQVQALIEAEPAVVGYRLTKANLLLWIGRIDDAAASLQDYLDLGGPSSAACYRLAELDFRRQRPDAALTRLEAAIAMDPGAWFYYFRMAQVLLGLKRHDQALAVLQRGYKANESDPNLATLLGELSESMGRLDVAEDAWARAVALDPGNAALRERLAAVMGRQGRAGP